LLTKTLFFYAKLGIVWDKMKKSKITFTVLLVFSLAVVSFTHFDSVAAESETVVVPDDYPTIQEAIHNAAEGDTVFVKNGVYEVDENRTIVIAKTLSLIGEDPDNTVILGVFGLYPDNDVAIRFAAPNITISGFTITNCSVAIAIANYYAQQYPSGCRITNNNIVNNAEGIRPQRNDLLISGNNITGNRGGGIMGYNAENIIITGNNISGNGYGINIGISRNVTVRGNNISGNTRGLNLVYYGPYFVYGNNITKNECGIRFAEGCQNATVSGNNITQNSVGVVLLNFPNGGDAAISGVGNTVFGNLFIDNSEQVLPNVNEYPNINMESRGTDIVLWDNGVIGNYWSDYNGTESDGNGVGDTPYIINENNQDNYPLMETYIIPEFPFWMPVFFVLSVVVVVVYKRRLSTFVN
jgi:nitrous oxidase accessory protein